MLATWTGAKAGRELDDDAARRHPSVITIRSSAGIARHADGGRGGDDFGRGELLGRFGSGGGEQGEGQQDRTHDGSAKSGCPTLPAPAPERNPLGLGAGAARELGHVSCHLDAARLGRAWPRIRDRRQAARLPGDRLRPL